jgi:hypothetical protein
MADVYDAFCPSVAVAVDYKSLNTLLAEGETLPFRSDNSIHDP